MAAKHARHDMREDKNFTGTDPSETTAQYLYCDITCMNGYVDISCFPRGSQCTLGSLGGKQSFLRSQAVINIHIL